MAPLREFAIIGLGDFGRSLALRLESLGHTVLGIDIERSKAEEIADKISEALILDATNEEALKDIGIPDFQTVIVAITESFEANALITASLKRLKIPHVICKASSDRHRDILLHIGADRVVQPEEDTGERLAEELSSPEMQIRIVLGRDQCVAEMRLPKKLIGKTISQAKRLGVSVLLIKRENNLLPHPPSETILQANDILVVLGDQTQLFNLNARK